MSAHIKRCTCPGCERRRSERIGFWITVAAAIVFWAGVALMTSCSSTVMPAPIAAGQASFDGTSQNSGIIALVDAGALVTPRARDRYNELIEIYGRDFQPPIAADHGVTLTAGSFLLSKEALQKFILMNAWHRMGRAPGKTTTP